MPKVNQIRVAELLLSRVCHDLIAPIGAICTGLEIFQEMDPHSSFESQEIFEIILASSKVASFRASFFRAAFSGGGNTLSPQDIQDLLVSYSDLAKMTLHWETPCPSEAPFKGSGRLLLNAIFCLSDCAPRGGALHITPQKEGFYSVQLKADPLILHPTAAEALRGTCSFQDLTPRNICWHLLFCLLKENGATCLVHHTPASSELTLDMQPSCLKKKENS